MCCPGSKGHSLLPQTLSSSPVASYICPRAQYKGTLTSLFFVGDLESYKKQAFVLKEGVEYRIKISFRVRIQI